MSPNGWYGQLAQTKQLLEVAAERFAMLTDGLDHPRIDTARDRLRASGAALTSAAGGISGWTRTWLGMVVLGVPAWAVGAVAGPLIGLPAGWVIAVTVAAVVGLIWPAYRLNDALAHRVNRRRTRPPAPLEIVTQADLDPAAEIISPPAASRRVVTASAVTTSVWAISCVALLSTVPSPAQPLVLAVTLAGTGVLSKLVLDVVVAIWDRRDARRLAAAVKEPEDVQRTIAELRARIGVIIGALEPDRNDRHLEVGRSIESALVWIDAADYASAETPER